MKKLYSFALLLVMLVITGFSASAVTATFKWETAGTISVTLGSTYNDPEELPAGATSYVANSGDAAFVRVYLKAAEGYIITGITKTDGSAVNYSKVDGYANVTVNSALADETLTVNCIKLERNDKFTFNVINGANRITKSLFTSSDYTLNLQKGDNTITFNPAIDTDLEIQVTIPGSNRTYADYKEDGKVGQMPYSFKLNGVEVTGTKYYNQQYTTYKIAKIDANSTISLQVYEVDPDAPKEYTVTLELPSGFENCVYSVRDWTLSKFVQFENGQLKVEEGTDLSVNFSSDTDYEYSAFYMNGEAVTPNNNSIRFKVTQNTTIKVEGTIKQYAQLPVTYYIQNPAGVKLNLMDGSDTSADLTGGTAVTQDITVSSINGTFTLKASETKKFDITVSEKKPMIEVECQEGYYVAAVIANEDGKNSFITSWVNVAELNPKVVYVQAIPTTNKYSYKTDIIGDPSYVTIKTANETIAGQWGNEYYRVKPTAAQQTFDFVVGFDNPFSVGVAADDQAVAQVYVDGKNSPADDTGVAFGFTPYVPASETALQAVSTLTVYVNGGAKTSGASLKLEGDATAQFLAGETLWAATAAGQQVLEGTKFTVVPASKDYVITYRGEIVNGINVETGEYIDGLDENGCYVFTPKGNPAANVVTVSPAPKFIDLDNISPAAGAEVRKLSFFEVTLPVVDETFETTFYPADALAAATVTDSEGKVVANFAELGEVGMNDNSEIVVPFTVTPAITTPGKYTLNIPANAFIQMGWDDAADGFAPVAGGYYSNALTAEYTVDPEAATIFDKYTLTPAPDAKIEALSSLTLTYNMIPFGTMVGYDFGYGKIYNDEESYLLEINYNWSAEENLEFNLNIRLPEEVESYEQGLISSFTDIEIVGGTWNVEVPAGIFELGYQANPAIKAVYTIGTQGIGSIASDSADSFTVVGIDGRVVLRNATADQVKNLDNGMYIINGKKVFVRK